MVKLFHHVLFSQVLEQVNDQEMRDGKSVHTIRDSCYHKEKDAVKTWGGWGGGGCGSKHVKGTSNHQLHKFTHLGSYLE